MHASGGPCGPAADVFSLACVAYELVSEPEAPAGGAPTAALLLLPVRNSVQEYRSKLMSPSWPDLTGVPLQAQGALAGGCRPAKCQRGVPQLTCLTDRLTG